MTKVFQLRLETNFFQLCAKNACNSLGKIHQNMCDFLIILNNKHFWPRYCKILHREKSTEVQPSESFHVYGTTLLTLPLTKYSLIKLLSNKGDCTIRVYLIYSLKLALPLELGHGKNCVILCTAIIPSDIAVITTTCIEIYTRTKTNTLNTSECKTLNVLWPINYQVNSYPNKCFVITKVDIGWFS